MATSSKPPKSAGSTGAAGKSGSNGSTTAKSGGSAAKGKESQRGALLEKFFHESLKDIYYAEKLLIKTLPKMRKAATTPQLQAAFETHLTQTKEQVVRLERVFELMGKKAQAKKCPAMDGLVKEGEEVIEETKEDTLTRDVGLIMAAQKAEHYEIASYGTLAQLAKTMGQHEIALLLEKTLNEEKETDMILTHIAQNNVNDRAGTEGSGERSASGQQSGSPGSGKGSTPMSGMSGGKTSAGGR